MSEKSNTLFHTFFFGVNFVFYIVVFFKILNGMANNVDPDQTAPWEQSDLGQQYLHMAFY